MTRMEKGIEVVLMGTGTQVGIGNTGLGMIGNGN